MKHTRLVITVLAITLIGAGCGQSNQPASTGTTNLPNNNVPNTSGNNQVNPVGAVTWMQTADGWQAQGTPPACPTPLIHSPVDLTKVTSILYPGQTRGGNYKPHGGFRFDHNTSNDQTVSAAMDGQVVDASRYLVSGETQYSFDITNPCGIMVRYGHLLRLTAKYQAIADALPPAKEGDSQTTNVNPNVPVTAGETIATAIGVTKPSLNVFTDFGVFDLRQKNTASANPAYLTAHPFPLDQHAICWFDSLPATDAATVRALPAGDPNSGKTSDYCK